VHSKSGIAVAERTPDAKVTWRALIISAIHDPTTGTGIRLWALVEHCRVLSRSPEVFAALQCLQILPQ
jgi:hypothetical protein